ncbi:hypothetical protein ABGB07_43960 [Micromonosporaceae bacterium B7E4]
MTSTFTPTCPFCSAELPADDPYNERHVCDDLPPGAEGVQSVHPPAGPAFDLEQVRHFLHMLHGRSRGQVHISSTDAWNGAAFVSRDRAADYVAELDQLGRAGIYVRATTLGASYKGQGRGVKRDSRSIPGLWADLDIAGPGHKHTMCPSGCTDQHNHVLHPLPPDEEAARRIVAESPLPEPSAWVHSGGGLYPWWLLDEPHEMLTDLDEIAGLSAGWQQVLGHAAGRLGWHYGTGVGDLPRVLRIPGTVNRKVPAEPRACRLLSDDGPRYTLDDLKAAVAAGRAAIPKPTSAAPSPARVTRLAGDRVSAGDDFAQRTSWADILEPHRWRFEYERNGILHWIRPEKDTPGISATTNARGTDRFHVHSTDAPPFQAQQSYSKFGVYALLNHGGDFKAARRALTAQGFGSQSIGRGAEERAIMDALLDQAEDGQRQGEAGAAEGAGQIDEEAFWTSRKKLTTIRAVARERLVSPWAVLAGVLAVVCSRVGPHVVLPGTVGSVASLNSFWALVGSSGSGKDAATAVARELVWLDDEIPSHEVGTGQGIDSSYTQQTPKHGPVQFCDAALFTISEIDTLAGHAKMNGSTIMATLRKVYTGSSLGARYADKEKRRPVREHRYRAAVLAGVQPARSHVLLGDADGGTPQRWIWIPTNDPGAAEWRARGCGLADAIVPHGGLWQQYGYLLAQGELTDEEIKDGKGVSLRDRVEIKVCETAKALVVENRESRLERDLVAVDTERDLAAHALLTRLKVAALLGIFDGGRAEVTEEDWALSGTVIAVSNRTRDICARALSDAAAKQNRARAIQAAERDNIVATEAEQRVARALLRKLRRHVDWMAHGDLRNTLRSGDRQFFAPAIENLINAGQVEAEAIDNDSMGRQVSGHKYRAVSK